MRRLLLSVVVLSLALAAPAAARSTCSSGDLRYPFMPGGPKDFGVFSLSVDGGSCSTAHRVAKSWMRAFEANIARGSTKLPKKAAGFAFKTLPATAAQQYNERGRRGAVTVRFAYRIPNG
jgi:hypothetical protein